ncbi:MAG TPA: M23 family metallopeptidase [Solimonas sp.]|nr:M23 family metallopeptidase [Solimonas sp.]
MRWIWLFFMGMVMGGLATMWVGPVLAPEADTPAPGVPLTVVIAAADAAPPAALPPAIAPVEPTPSAPTLASIPADLLIPVAGVDATQLSDSFADGRGGTHVHEAIDIMAPLGTPVWAVADGHVVKLFTSALGGLTVYQFDASETWTYYYAHLDRYAEGLVEGQQLRRGDLIGYVGASGNASPAAPHLHFAIFLLGPDRRWWQGIAINPYPLLTVPSS